MNYFKKLRQIKQNHNRLKIKDISPYDSIFVKTKNGVYTGWVLDKHTFTIEVCYCVSPTDIREIEFFIKDKSEESIIEKDGKFLYLNEFEIPD